jgi:hypothetical protein
MTSWNDDTQLSVFKLLIPETIDIRADDSIDELKEKVLAQYYPYDMHYLHQTRADATKHDDFALIDDYIQAIKRHVQILGFSGRLNKTEQQHKFEE